MNLITNIGAIAIIKRKPNKSNAGVCYSCIQKKCTGFEQAMNKITLVPRYKVIICDKYKEQILDMKKADYGRISTAISNWIWKSVQGQHNITQQSDGFQHMEETVIRGILYCLRHRYTFNLLKGIGEHIDKYGLLKREK